MKLNELKLIVQSLVEKMTCPFCQQKIKESQVDIMHMMHNHCALKIHCPQCQKQTIIQANIQARPVNRTPQINLANQKDSAFDPQSLKNLSQNLENLKGDLKDIL